ncbi:phosphoglycerate mutase-like protein [Neocallimastix californiae]|jgi:probable phosphoglycerate mutase|uniref:Phosphoglycerate mutase-like protein n=1 Tax=Neocallimastix californiae TaxID=1754190 RepID=A0A1Y2DID8_9FUNG|nr:phosphoglycerate mutase-like protein [Neocallimastix californiae]|eukprot:ORY59008.1 phosphoglycerate mutase-like protein [Neocallimastix californiae]
MNIPEIPPVIKPPSNNCKVKRIIFCRHAETTPNASFQLQGSGINESLNSKGINQAEALARRLASQDIEVIITSNLRRAVQTSEIIADVYPKPLKIIEEPELREISWGVWEGMVCPDLQSLLEIWQSGDFTASAPGGETPLDVRDRVLPIIYSLLKRPEKTILVVLHGRILRILLSSILYGNLYHMQSFHHRNTCVNVVDVYYEPVKNKNSPTSLANLSSVKTYEPKRKQLYPLVKSLSGGGIIISPVGLNKKTNYYGNGNGSFRMISKNNENKSNFNDRETPIFDVDLSGNDYKVKFMPIILDSVEHLTADLY